MVPINRLQAKGAIQFERTLKRDVEVFESLAFLECERPPAPGDLKISSQMAVVPRYNEPVVLTGRQSRERIPAFIVGAACPFQITCPLPL